ncbi:hypothetical protein ACFZA9_06410 [Streptomyces olivaceus]|uniref:hypothetical protein n=1 Tax=Streptomyces olivaceus TaxID=47716 RepID=UPI0036EECB38
MNFPDGDSQFAAAQLISAVAHAAPDTPLPVSALAHLLALNEDEIHTLYDSHMTALDAVRWTRSGAAAHILTDVFDAGVSANVR